jgi:hypothetical protein
MPTKTETSFVLSRLVLAVSAESQLADPGLIVDEVMQRIRPTERQEALRQALVLVVPMIVTRTRSPLPSFAHSSPPDHQETPAGAPAQRQQPTPPRPSWKVTGIREAWQRALQNRIKVGTGEDDWKFLSQCTSADLAHAASIREELARRNADRASQYRQLADLVTSHGVETVGELPDTVLSQTLTEDEV